MPRRTIPTASRVALIWLAVPALLGAGTVSGVVPPAHAHDQLVEAAPADGAQLAENPEQIRLRYSSELIPIGTEVRVTDEQGRDWVDGTAAVSGRTVTQPLRRGADGGRFTIRWRVVSSDGHPISGRQTYSVSPAAAAGTSVPPAPVTPTPATTASPETDDPPPADPPPADSVAAADTTSTSASSAPLVWVAVLIGVGAVIALAWWLSRRRST